MLRLMTLELVTDVAELLVGEVGELRLNPNSVIGSFSDLFILRGIPACIRLDTASELVAQAVRDWIDAVGAKAARIEPEALCENGYCASLNARCSAELLYREILSSLGEAQLLIEQSRRYYNTKGPHSALGYRPPVPETSVQLDQRPVMH